MRAALGAASVDLTMGEDASVEDAVRQLAEGQDSSVRATLLREDGALQPTLVVALGSEQVRDTASQRLRDGDTVTILHPISGG